MTENNHGKVKISIIGSRGIPAKYGGFETFAGEISPLLAENGLEVTVQCDVNSYDQNTYKGVNLFFSSVAKSDNPLRYYLEGLRWSFRNSDIVIVSSTAGSFFYILNSLRKKLIITNPDGLEHQRKKWSIAKRVYLKFSEVLAVKLSDYLVVDSEAIKKYLISSYRNAGGKIRVIEYGAYQNIYIDNAILEKYSLEQNKYYLVVSRLEPENNLDMIIDGFLHAMTVFPLVIVGNILNNPYVKRLVNIYSSDRIKFIGGIYDRQELNALRYSCKAYLHGHSVGGTNPSLLEAMGSRNIILAHDNVFNREVTSGDQFYFSSSEQCRKGINEIELLTEEEAERYKVLSYSRISNKYNWNNILKKYLDLFKEISA
jgi:glycosyltransferase involved in cell wall biosynthesis